jgi:putative lumazine-binding protein
MKNLNLEDYRAIKETVQLYIEGGISGKSEVMENAFHKEATIYGWIFTNPEDPSEKTQLAGPISLLYDFVNNAGPAVDLDSEFVRIDIVGTSANVKLELSNWLGMRFTDTLNLLKIDEGWKIVSKVTNQVT